MEHHHWLLAVSNFFDPSEARLWFIILIESTLNWLSFLSSAIQYVLNCGKHCLQCFCWHYSCSPALYYFFILKSPFLCLKVQQTLEARAASFVGPPPAFVAPGEDNFTYNWSLFWMNEFHILFSKGVIINRFQSVNWLWSKFSIKQSVVLFENNFEVLRNYTTATFSLSLKWHTKSCNTTLACSSCRQVLWDLSC